MSFLFVNNFSSTLADPIAPSDLTITLAAGAGALLPTPSAGQELELTLTDAATRSLIEIVYMTGRSGDVLTVSRGQEGTTAQTWAAGTIVQNRWTAGQAEALQAGVIPPVYTVFTTSGTYTVTSDTIEVEGCAGGGGGSGTDGSFGGGCGGAGGYFRGVISGLTIGSMIAITIGAGGLPGAALVTGTGGVGGTTSVGSYMSATGGNGGNVATAFTAGGKGGLGSGGSIVNLYGGDGSDGNPLSGNYPVSGQGGASFYGGGGRTGTGGAGGGADGQVPGAGGGGAYLASGPGGAGAPGIVIIKTL